MGNNNNNIYIHHTLIEYNPLPKHQSVHSRIVQAVGGKTFRSRTRCHKSTTALYNINQTKPTNKQTPWNVTKFLLEDFFGGLITTIRWHQPYPFSKTTGLKWSRDPFLSSMPLQALTANNEEYNPIPLILNTPKDDPNMNRSYTKPGFLGWFLNVIEYIILYLQIFS